MARSSPPRWSIDDLLARTDLTQLLDELAQPASSAQHGRRWHCPVAGHDDHHPSVTMYTDHRHHERWRCWSGDDAHRGDAIDLIQATHHLDRTAAIAWLAARAGLASDLPAPPPRRARQPAPRADVPLDPAVVAYTRACEHILWTRTGRPIRYWLQDRGLNDETLAANHIGADPGHRYLRRTTGLPRGTTPAATFPALNQTPDITYVQARCLHPDPGQPKYTNPTAALGTNPRISWTVTPDPSQSGLLIICEGIPDALTATQAGYHAAAILGSHYPDPTTAQQLAQRANSDNLTLVAVIDNDDAGHRWADRLGQLLNHHGQALHALQPPGPGLDLNTWAQQDPEWPAWLPSPAVPPRAVHPECPASLTPGRNGSIPPPVRPLPGE